MRARYYTASFAQLSQKQAIALKTGHLRVRDVIRDRPVPGEVRGNGYPIAKQEIVADGELRDMPRSRPLWESILFEYISIGYSVFFSPSVILQWIS